MQCISGVTASTLHNLSTLEKQKEVKHKTDQIAKHFFVKAIIESHRMAAAFMHTKHMSVIG